ncbi:MAG: cupin domain-containing protein [Pseudomonadota bacterium]
MTVSKPLGLIAAIALVTSARAEVEKVTLNEMPLAKTPIAGVSSAMVSGAMNAPGAFGANAIMRAGSVFPPHSHPDARMSLVLEGTMYLGIGETVDPGAEQAFEAGTLAVTPAGTPHWMVARDGDVRILEIGTGPTQTDWAAQ